ncbi:unnamed protein product [Closterium sp. NIES-65]|nr:unnamed protein product [Closterium sp. NIES-65]
MRYKQTLFEINVKGAGKLTYLGYANDTTLLLNGRSQLGEAELLLKEFEQVSGLAVNWDKSVVLPLGSQRDIPPPADGAFKWASRNDPERLLGVWITPGGGRKAVMEEGAEQDGSGPKEMGGRISHHHNACDGGQRVCHAHRAVPGADLPSAGHDMGGAEEAVSRFPRKEGGLGVTNLKDRLDAEALHSLAQLLTEEMPQRRLLAERAANFPLCYASLLAHEALLKAWGTGSERWKAITAAAMSSPVVRNLTVGSRWDIEKERVLFNRHILRDGGHPFGRRKGDEAFHEIMVGDVLMKWADDTRSWKSTERLARDLGSKCEN